MKAETNRAPAAPYPLCKKCGTYHGHACLGVREAAPVPASTGRDELPWRCFHCEETFTDREAARLHFGNSERQKPACQFDIAEVREMEARIAAYSDEDAEVHREMHAQATKHAQALLREEEKGYARGLRDAKLVAASELDADAERPVHPDIDGVMFETLMFAYRDAKFVSGEYRDVVAHINAKLAEVSRAARKYQRKVDEKIIEHARRATAESTPASAAPREQWISVDERLPEVHSNDYAEFIVSCTRKSGKAYVFSAHYLNGKLLQPDDDEPEDGLPVSGWYFETEVDGDNVFDPVCEPGDAITHWHALPTAPSNSPVGAKEQE